MYFKGYGVNPFVEASDDRVSTFALEVDTGAATVVRNYLEDGRLPPPEAVRVEEMVNAFAAAHDPPPEQGDVRLVLEGGPSPYTENERSRVLRAAVRFRDVDRAARPPAVLTFVVDTSGSMARDHRLGLVQRALASLLVNLEAHDRVGLVSYGSHGQVLVEPTTDHELVRRTLDRLVPSGSTNAEEGLVLGYRLADDFFHPGGVNRVVLFSDGVANVGRTGPESILERIRTEARRGVELTAVGVGMGNYNDVLLEQLADAADGRYAYVDTFDEARRLFVDELTGTLFTVAHDAKAQVELNPEVVRRWRLLGYENRDVADDRFRDPTVDAGEIGAGHTVVAVYEVELADDVPRRATVATLRVRYRPTGSTEEVEVATALTVGSLARSWETARPVLRLAATVAELAELLRGSYWARHGSFQSVVTELDRLAAELDDPRIAEVAGLARIAARLAGDTDHPPAERDRP
jgi:Ca-activated chloride channel family protein